MHPFKHIDFFRLESKLWLAKQSTYVPAYDFSFEPTFRIDRPRPEGEVEIIARIGAIQAYREVFQLFQEYGFNLIHTPEQHERCSQLEAWYPIIEELTPRSKVYEKFPSLEVFYQDFKFPVFIKGNRQTSKHELALSIAQNEEQYQQIKQTYPSNAILHWQKVAIREFIPLRPLAYETSNKVQISFEFRTFWWKQILVGVGHYWSQYIRYDWTDTQKEAAIRVAKIAVEKLDVPFLVVDLALTLDDQWIIIECNDAQESGYCGIKPIILWKNILDLEK